MPGEGLWESKDRSRADGTEAVAKNPDGVGALKSPEGQDHLGLTITKQAAQGLNMQVL